MSKPKIYCKQKAVGIPATRLGLVKKSEKCQAHFYNAAFTAHQSFLFFVSFFTSIKFFLFHTFVIDYFRGDVTD